jgi:GDP-L-fucose synthase
MHDRLKGKNIYVAGHNGMVGSAINSLLAKRFSTITNISSSELNLTRQADTESFFDRLTPDIVIICAAKVGGILANSTYRGQFIYDNLQIATNLIHAAKNHNVEKLIFLGSSCIYPKNANQPIKEEALLTSELEQTNEPYAIAKIAGIKLCENYHKEYGCNFYSLMPCNLFGENDNFDLETSHVLPALIRKFHEAKLGDEPSVELWGSGKPLREFLYVQDLANIIERCLETVEAADIYAEGISHLNVGSRDEVSIQELAEIIQEVVEYEGELTLDPSKPDGTMRKKMDNSRIEKLGFKQQFSLKEAIKKTYNWYLNR